MTSTTTYTPFTYCLTFLPTGKRYYGVRYANNKREVAHPTQLWTTYFTSSKTIKSLIEEHGKDSFSFQVRKTFTSRDQACSWETKFLTRIDAAKHPEWLNAHNGSSTFYADEVTYKNIQVIKKRNNTEASNIDIILKQVDTKKKNGTMNNSSPESIQRCKDTKKKNNTGMDNPVTKQRALDSRKKNGTMNNSSPESIQKQLDTKKKNGTLNSNTPESIQRCKDTKKKNGTINASKYQHIKDKKILTCMLNNGVDNPSKVMFLSIIETKKTYAKNLISRYYPDLKQYY